MSFLKIFNVLKSWDHGLSRLLIHNLDFPDGSAKVPRSRRLVQIRKISCYWNHHNFVLKRSFFKMFDVLKSWYHVLFIFRVSNFADVDLLVRFCKGSSPGDHHWECGSVLFHLRIPPLIRNRNIIRGGILMGGGILKNFRRLRRRIIRGDPLPCAIRILPLLESGTW